MDSKTADIANVGFTPNPAGGMMVGAAFLQEFVDEKTPWVHIDIAPPAFNKAFVGIHPLCKQVPPRTSRSIRATFKPSWEPRNAAA